MSLSDPVQPAWTPNLVKLSIATTEPPAGQPIPNSNGTGGNQWQGLVWNVDDYDPPLLNRPNGMHDPNGWSILYGPALFVMTAFLRVKQQTLDSALHLMPRRAKRINGVNTIVGPPMEASEWGVLANETHLAADGDTTYSNTHLFVPMIERLEVDERLQVHVDMWNADQPARVAGGTVTLLWWPLA
jgi:hypothetical protein